MSGLGRRLKAYEDHKKLALNGKPETPADSLRFVAEMLCGEDGVRVIDALLEGGEMTAEEISTKAGMDLNTVRRILYRLHDHALVASRSERDEETGWFIYKWVPQPTFVSAFIKSVKKDVLKRLRARLRYERSHVFFHCGTGDPPIPFEEAVELMFRCPRCGGELKAFDNAKIIEVLEEKIRMLEDC